MMGKYLINKRTLVVGLELGLQNHQNKSTDGIEWMKRVDNFIYIVCKIKKRQYLNKSST